MSSSKDQSLMNYCYLLTGNKWDAEDLWQDTYIKLNEQHKKAVCSPAYDRTVARNHWIDNLRKKNREQMLIAQLQEQSKPTGSQESGECLELIRKLSGLLTAKQITVFFLKDVFMYQLNEIAALIEKPESTVKSLLFRARQQLKKIHIEFEEIERGITEAEELLLIKAIKYENPSYLFSFAERTGLRMNRSIRFAKGMSAPRCAA
ncbi:sigma-70 family RNA polymerase sigma factor [Bacillus capparidis]|uniref:RNA polymerase sigma-70 factor (ECF subfamily) n=1 Tax=Bacillus capparidis TaxID=1840411 RepID=A0ABS4CS09_9BACI|nr:sigma-70 family RNA polymerase sigma factor [Bacillus capparidis]MBP1080311.1 RNA polymerase sigma-70 factor (ECF subfamily) [Bacillus capparidis]MED1094174.1 sigma-70 family RNA polymerase sigma factor [Bacillus capparidis]